MKKIFGLVGLLLTIYTTSAQEIVLPGTATSNDYSENLAIGNITPSIDLFSVETKNPKFNLSAKLSYSPFVYFYEEEHDYTAKSYFGKGWDINIIPNITKWIAHHSVDEEAYYSSPHVQDCEGEIFEPNRYQFNIFGIQGGFVFKEDNGQMKVVPYYSSEYVDIKVDYDFSTTSGQEIFQINSFTVTDKNGYQYIFNEKQETWYEYFKGPSFIPNHYSPYCFGVYKTNRSFLLSQVKDKYGVVLMNYQYQSYTDEVEIGTHDVTDPDQTVPDDYEYEQKYLSSISVAGLSTIDFVMDLSKKEYSSIEIRKSSSLPTFGLQKKIDFIGHTSSYSSHRQIVFKNKDLEEDYNYEIRYSLFPEGAYNHVEIISPLKGKTRYEFENNDYGYRDDFPEEFTFYEEEELPVTDLSSSSYSKYSFYCPDEYLNSDDEIYISYTTYIGPGLTDPNGNPIESPPTPIRLYTANNTFLTEFGGPDDDVLINDVLNTYKNNFSNNVFYVGYMSMFPKILNVKVVRKYEVSSPPLVSKKTFKGFRISKIINKDSEGNVVSEKKFSYLMKDDPYRSSGTIPFRYGIGGSGAFNPSLYDFMAHYIYYKCVSVEETGKGKTTYDFQGTPIGVSDEFFRIHNLSNIPKKVYAYNDNGNLLNTKQNDFDLHYLDAEFSITFQSPILKKLTTTSDLYIAGSTTKKLRTITESTFDTISRHMTQRKITDVRMNETFEENHEYQKLGNAYYETAVKKYKNGTMINQSKAEYAPLNNGTLADAYALQKSSTAKGTQPFEVEREITLYDNKGNVLEYKTKEGTYVSQIWAYSDSKVVAELKNVRYDEISSTTISNIKAGTAPFVLVGTPSLEVSFESLRTAHSQGFITTYTYIPMVGIKTTTDANGRKETYQYDNSNRLYRILDHEGNIVKEYNYNIKN